MRQNTNTEVIVIDGSNDSSQPVEVPPPTKAMSWSVLLKRLKKDHAANTSVLDKIDRNTTYQVPADVYDDDEKLYRWFFTNYFRNKSGLKVSKGRCQLLCA